MKDTNICDQCRKEFNSEEVLTCITSHVELEYFDLDDRKACMDNLFYCKSCLNENDFCITCAEYIPDKVQKEILRRLGWETEMIELSLEQAHKIISRYNLMPGCSFTNLEPSELCSEYRVETGFWFPNGGSKVVEFVNTKDENNKEVKKAYLYLDGDIFGNEKRTRRKKTYYRRRWNT